MQVLIYDEGDQLIVTSRSVLTEQLEVVSLAKAAHVLGNTGSWLEV